MVGGWVIGVGVCICGIGLGSVGSGLGWGVYCRVGWVFSLFFEGRMGVRGF